MEDFKFLKGYCVSETVRKYRSMRHDWPTLKQYIKDHPEFAGSLIKLCCPISLSMSEFFRGVCLQTVELSDNAIEILFRNREL